MKKTITIAVTDFALPSPLRGSIDTHSGFSSGQLFGIQIHQDIQQQRLKTDPTYEAETWISHKFRFAKYNFEVSGKIDGSYRNKIIKIEEIKSTFNLDKLYQHIQANERDHPYCLQIKTYGYMYWLKTSIIPDLQLLLVSSRNKKELIYPLVLNVENYEEWLQSRLKDLVQEIETLKKHAKRRKKAAKLLKFPFAQPRPGQSELIEKISSSMASNKNLLIQAPTGLGKTIGVLYPALIDSMQRGQKSIYLTPKNSQHIVALDAVKGLQRNGANIKTILLTSKKKICMKQEPLCNAEYCEFAENHYTKTTQVELLTKLQNESVLDVHAFKKVADAHQVCPYEVQMDMVKYSDVVICDYNYVFSPSAANNKVSKIEIGENEKQNIIIDEAHNLPNRAIDYYSPSLSVMFLERIERASEHLDPILKNKFQTLLSDSISIIMKNQRPNSQAPHVIKPIIKDFAEQTIALREFLLIYFESDAIITSGDCVMALYNYWTEFTNVLEWILKENREEFFIAYKPNPPEISINCCDASKMLQPLYDQYSHVVGFSATLKPFDYYSKLMGLENKKLQTEEFFSPFPKERRKLILIPQLSSKYSDRQRNYPRIAEAIKKICEVQQGNYFAFFPSFNFLDNVLKLFEPPLGFNILSQTPSMQQKKISDLLNLLSDKNNNYIVFGVQGGALSEGIDYPGKLAIGAFIVGAPLPSFDWQREKLKAYYEQHYSAGLDYTYTYPAMAKAVQAAGRVIRSETDKGVIILMDDRFLLPNFFKCMPNDWFDTNPNEMISQQILEDLRQFWAQEHQ